jgi:hypothetical protein
MPLTPLPVHIAPSILAADFARLGDDIARCAHGGSGARPRAQQRTPRRRKLLLQLRVACVQPCVAPPGRR